MSNHLLALLLLLLLLLLFFFIFFIFLFYFILFYFLHPGFISLLVFACVLAGSVTFVSVVLLAVYPESLQRSGDTLKILYPNDTILAVPDGGLDPSRIKYILYEYSGVEELEQHDMNETDRLLFYKQQCNNLKPQSRVVDVDKSFTIPEDDFVSLMIDHQYLLNGSSIEYQINITLTPETVPSHCYAELVLRDEQSNGESVEICNNTEATFPVKATRDGYALVVLIPGFDVRLKAINIKTSGTLYYYDVVQSKAQLACEIDPSTNPRCSIPVRNNANLIGSSNKVCILAIRESSYTSKSFEFEYYTAVSFAYGQVILICVGLVSFVCMCGLSISLCTKPGRRLREALHMSRP